MRITIKRKKIIRLDSYSLLYSILKTWWGIINLNILCKGLCWYVSFSLSFVLWMKSLSIQNVIFLIILQLGIKVFSFPWVKRGRMLTRICMLYWSWKKWLPPPVVICVLWRHDWYHEEHVKGKCPPVMSKNKLLLSNWQKLIAPPLFCVLSSIFIFISNIH